MTLQSALVPSTALSWRVPAAPVDDDNPADDFVLDGGRVRVFREERRVAGRPGWTAVYSHTQIYPVREGDDEGEYHCVVQRLGETAEVRAEL